MLRGFLSRPGVYRSPETGTSGGAGSSTPPSEPQAATGAGQALEPAKTEEKKFTQADVNQIVEERLNRERRKTADDADKAKAEAERKALEEQGKWKELADQRAAELTKAQLDIETGKATGKSLERHEKALKEHVATLLKDVPEHIKSLLDKLDAVEQLEWITKNQDALKPKSEPQQRGNGTPKPNDQRKTAGSSQQQTSQPVRRRIDF